MRGSAIVTGAARGIGAATVLALAADGWAVVAMDRCKDDPRLPYPLGTRAELDAVVAAAGGGGEVVALVGDAAEETALSEAVELAEQLGDLGAVVAVAGAIAGGVPAWELPAEHEQAVLEINLGATIAAARIGIPALLRREQPRRGRFVAVGSAAATRGMPGLAAYSAAKAGISAFVRGLATDLRGTGVTANAVSPGSTETPLLEESARLYGLESPQAFAPQQPLDRLIDPAEVAALIAWLAGPASSAVTGATLAVDGGLSL
ncbi:MAG: mycofactocin-coupled SDR family oxidoreductase [Solirubrobacterales bacterium]